MYSEIAANKRKTIVMFMMFIVLVAGLSWVFAQFMQEPLITPYVLIGALVYIVVSYYASSKMALAINSAKEITKKDNPRLYRIVENLAITEGMPMPKVCIMQDKALNAFATGRDPKHATVCATTGLLDALNDQELQGVMAHELGHVKNYDIRVSMLAFAMVAVISIMADIMIRMTWFRGSGNDRAGQLMVIIGIVAAILAPLAAALIQMSISRKREYLADASGALTTRYPEGLASALEKIKHGGSVPKAANSSTAHLFFANPLKKGSIGKAFSTHPPIDDRINRLRSMGDKL